MIKILKNMGKKEVIMAVICIVLVAAQVYFDLTLPDYMTELTVRIKTGAINMSEIWIIGAKMLGYATASGILAIICGFLAAKVAAGLTYRVRERIFGHIMDLGKQDMQKFSTPSLINRTTNDVTQVQMLIAMGLQILVKAPITAIWAVVKILNKSWQLSSITALAVVLIISTVFTILLIVLPKFKLVQRQMDRINKLARENLNGISVVHAYNAEDYQDKKFDEANTSLNKIQLFNQRAFCYMEPIMSLIMNGLSLSVYWVGAVLLNGLTAVSAKEVFFGDLTVFNFYAMQVVMSFMMLIMIFMFLPPAQVSAKRINEVLDAKPSIVEGKKVKGTEVGTVEFKNVFFRYPGSADDELKDINFKVEKGQTIAFIGATGSGKTTLISLIARFFDATSGQVLVDGVDVKDYTFDALYNKIGYITQKAVLFGGSIKDNVDFGESKEKLSDNMIKKALSFAEASEFVEKLDGGINYHISQGGTNVSGGQKQRLSIARAVARKPEILIFDDSFSAVDYKTDAKLRQNMAEKLKNTTSMIVAQRISTIMHADNIIVLDDGKIVGCGKHEELLQSCKLYKEIALSQLSSEELLGGQK